MAAGRIGAAAAAAAAARAGALARRLPAAARSVRARPTPGAAAAPVGLARALATHAAPLEGRAAELVRLDDPTNNITPNVAAHIGRDLLSQPNHPLQIIKTKIFDYFDEAYPSRADGAPHFEKVDKLDPVVPIHQAFDEILIPADHVSRSFSDTFYFDANSVLRPHTSAHQTELIRAGKTAFLCAGDVYRRDEIDQTHYPVFHQMEGVFIFPEQGDAAPSKEAAEADLKRTLEGMVRAVFGDVEMRWVGAYFPFTEPSLELEIFFNDEWLEVLGAGVIHQTIMDNCGVGNHRGWAFGLGIERLAMVLFDIPDIRLFWSRDERFSEQFRDGVITKFKPYSKYPPCLKDISFWLPESGFHENDFYSVVREIGGDLIERVELIDAFKHPKTNRDSQCYRITFRSMDRSLTNAEIDEMQEDIRAQVESKLAVELR